jgi:hypothetical protein
MLLVQRGDGGAAGPGRQAGGVPQQVDDGDRVPRRASSPGGRVRQHAELAELGQVAADRVLEQERALLEQAEQGHAHDRLRHRVDAEDRVQRHRLVALHVTPSVGVGQHDLTAPGHDRDDARQPPGVDVAACVSPQLPQPLAVQADLVGGCVNGDRGRAARCVHGSSMAGSGRIIYR